MSKRGGRGESETRGAEGQGEFRHRDCTWWLSFSARYLVNVEDLNNVESTGNYVRHRRAPIVFVDGNTYSIVYVPAVSGEMIGHGYQMNLVLIANQVGLPVDTLAQQGYLLKRGGGDDPHQGTKCSDKSDPHEYEKCVIEEDVVEDVAGFLNPNKTVKRVSNISFSYLVPAMDAVKKVAIAPQFHVRYAPPNQQNLQNIYNVEVASASYVLTGYLDLCGVGCTQNGYFECLDNRVKRVIAATDALNLTLTQFLFGAKRTRINPIIRIEGLVVTLSEKPFNAGPIYLRDRSAEDYLKELVDTANSYAKALGLSSKVSVVYYFDNQVKTVGSWQGFDKVEVESVGNPAEVFVKVKEKINAIMSKVGGSTAGT